MAYEIVDQVAAEAQEMRRVFAATMIEMARADDKVVYFDCDLMNSIGMVPFAKEFPERAFDCGIMEANMVGIAGGISAAGYKPFIHSFGVFATRRVVDQVFLSAAYGKNNVRIVGSDPGVTAAANGGTHMPLEDMGIMRGIPEVTVLEPTDCAMLRDLLLQTKDMHGVFYIRLARKIVAKIYRDGSTFIIGKAAPLRRGTDVTILCSGICVEDSLKAAELLAQEGISASVANVFTWKPLDREFIAAEAAKTGAVVTVENHNIINGLGSAVAECLGETCCVPLERVGVRDLFGEVGSVGYLKERFGLTAADIAAAAKRAAARKAGRA